MVSLSDVHGRNKVTLPSLSEDQREYQRVPAYNKQTCPGIQSVPFSVILTQICRSQLIGETCMHDLDHADPSRYIWSRSRRPYISHGQTRADQADPTDHARANVCVRSRSAYRSHTQKHMYVRKIYSSSYRSHPGKRVPGT